MAYWRHDINPGSVVADQLWNDQTDHHRTWPRVTSACFWIVSYPWSITSPSSPQCATTTADPPTCQYGDHHSSRAGHDHITTRLLQLSASRLTAVHTRPAAECCSMGYIQCWQAGTHLTVPWATALATSTSTGAVQIVHSDACHPQQTMSSVHRWRRTARRNGVNANWSPFCGQQQLFSTTSEYQSRRARRFIRRSGCLEPTTREHPPAANYIFQT